MIKIAIVGTGNISHHLSKAISKTNGLNIVQIINSRKAILENSINQPDIYIVAVS